MGTRALSAEDLAAALAGQRGAIDALVEELTPVVQARVARTLRSVAAAHRRDSQQEVADLTQDVFVALLTDDARVLRSWRPDGGLSLLNFIGLVAERRVLSVLRSPRRAPYQERPEDDLSLTMCSRAGPERAAAKRELLERVHNQLRATLSPKALDLFYRLFVHEQTVQEICQATGLTAPAVYAHRHRLKQATARAWAEANNAPGPQAQGLPAMLVGL